MKAETTDTTHALTEAQATILDKFATIQAELECLVRETRRARMTLDSRTQGEND
jgi:hypothetical protein